MASSSSSVLLRLGKFAGSSSCNSGKWTARSVASRFNRRGVATAAPPLLMQPPKFEDDGAMMSYKLYSPAENKVQTLSPSDDVIRKLKCRGSSRGWLALLSPHNNNFFVYNSINNDFFLYNPITHRRIKLPSIHSLPRTSKYDARDIMKFILSCSPDEDEENCRVVISAGDINPLAFCCPGRSKEWTLIWDEKRGMRRQYHDCVYSTRQKLFFGLTTYDKLETWDLGDPSSPRLINVVSVQMSGFSHRSKPTGWIEKMHLVVANQDLLLVCQYCDWDVGPDGSCFDSLDETKPDNCHRMSVDFQIFKYDPKKGSFDRSSSLGGLALFLGGRSDSVAIPATRFPGLKPNSVYFTDIYTESLSGYLDDDESFGTGHDIGIFNCEDRTVSPCYYPCDPRSLKKIVPAPMWFFPSHPI